MTARKDDTGKRRYDLIPVQPLAELAHVYTVGAAKYEDHNWRKGMDWSRIIGAMQRHMEAFRSGESRHDDNMHHLASVAWGAFTLMEYEARKAGNDNRADKQGDTLRSDVPADCRCNCGNESEGCGSQTRSELQSLSQSAIQAQHEALVSQYSTEAPLYYRGAGGTCVGGRIHPARCGSNIGDFHGISERDHGFIPITQQK